MKDKVLIAILAASLAGCGGSGVSTIDAPNSIAIADVNGDGTPDLLIAVTGLASDGSGPNPGFASVMLGNTGTAGTFQAGIHTAIGNNPSSIAAADLDGNGSIDAVVANFADGSVSVLLQDSSHSGHYMAPVTISTGGNPNQVTIADVNGDGKPDLVLADEGSTGRIIIVLQDPATPGHFLSPTYLTGINPAAGVAVGDLNGDGKPDIVAATADVNGNNGAVSIFYQDPDNPGSFPAHVEFAAGAGPTAVKIADLNGDDLPDLAVADQGPGTDGTGSAGATVLLQDGANPGSFHAPVTYATHSGTIDIVVADLNGDDLPDLAVANLGPSPTGSVSVLLQDPSTPGVFQTAVSYGGFGQPLGLAVGDLNHDGLPDIAVADADGATVMLQNAATPGTFATAVAIGN